MARALGFWIASTVVAAAAVHATATDRETPVCTPSEVDCQDLPSPHGSAAWNEENNYVCSLWDWEGWIMMGKDVPVGGHIGYQDIVVPFEHHERVFPKWRRNGYFWNEPGTNRYIFAPAYVDPIECHNRFWNMVVENPLQTYADRSTSSTTEAKPMLSTPMTAARGLSIADPILMPCHDPELSAKDTYQEFPEFYTQEDLETGATCVDRLYVQETENGEWGSFTKWSVIEGDIVVEANALHLHRRELHNKDTGVDEVLLNYCYGHADTDLLLLPLFPGVSTIRHDDVEPNVEWAWNHDEEAHFFFRSPTERLFSEFENTMIFLKLVAKRDLVAGEELKVDYGPVWKSAFEQFKAGNQEKPFRHERSFHEGFFPQQWLAMESRGRELPTLENRKLQAGELDVVRLKGGEALSEDGLYRIGLPDDFADKMEAWAEQTGLADVMRSYIVGNMTLPINGDERQRINGGTWWIKRFWAEWRSNMHYASPDDPVSNKEFMYALADSGFDHVLKSIGEFFGLQSLTCYYASIIAVSHATYSEMHADSTEPGQFNLIFPIIQVENSEPELTLAPDDSNMFVPYTYERDHACLLHANGQHGTAPCDYRAGGNVRMVISVYFGDFTDENRLEMILENWDDPPYPRVSDRYAYLKANQHWSATNPDRSLKSPM